MHMHLGTIILIVGYIMHVIYICAAIVTSAAEDQRGPHTSKQQRAHAGQGMMQYIYSLFL